MSGITLGVKDTPVNKQAKRWLLWTVHANVKVDLTALGWPSQILAGSSPLQGLLDILVPGFVQ